MRANAFPMLLSVLLAYAICRPPTIGAEPPRQLYLSGYKTPLQAVASPGTVPGYVRKNTWHETMRASLAVAFGPADAARAAAPAAEYAQVRDALWELVARDFRDRQSQIEMELERRDGIWAAYAPAGNEVPSGYYRQHAQTRLELARKTLEFVKRQPLEEEWSARPGRSPLPDLAAELEALEHRVAQAAQPSPAAAERDLFARAVDLRRRILF